MTNAQQWYDVPGIYQVLGPPGTGKTTWLLEAVEKAYTQGLRFSPGDEYTQISSHDITIVAFTRAAALNAIQRLSAQNIEIEPDNIGTLHSLTLKALMREAEENSTEKPRLFADATTIKQWNEANPQFTLSSSGDDEDSTTAATPTDKLMTQIDGLRARKVPEDQWPSDLKPLWKTYIEYKQDYGLCDFTDLIHNCLEKQLAPPGLAIMMADEAQDFSPLEWDLLNLWSEFTAYTIFIGDDDQAIYSGLKGASPKHFIDLDIPDTNRITLQQSYRVPQAPHAFAQAITEQMTHRIEKTYLPREERGMLRISHATWMKPEPMMDSIRKEVAAGHEVMILAYSKYMLEPTLKALREARIAYHNPYRPNYGAWNPLGQDSGSGTTAKTRLRAYLANPWTAADILLWSPLLASTGIWPRGMRDRMKDDLLTLESEVVPDIRAYFHEDALTQLESRDLQFFSEHLAKRANNGRMQFCLDLAKMDMLNQEPQVIPGTVHSIKGGEAQTVILFPDFPEAANDPDENLRVMYVGATRPTQTLVIATPLPPRDPTQEANAMNTVRMLARARQILRTQEDNEQAAATH